MEMAHNYSIESLTSRTSVDSCFNDAMLLSSTDTLSETINENLVEFVSSSVRTNSQATTDNNACIFETKNTVNQQSIKYDRTYEETRKKLESMTKDLEQSIDILSHTLNDTDKDFCDTFEDYTTNNIEKSKLWPSLTMLQKNLAGSNESTEDKDDKIIINNLHDIYDYDPINFTEHLLTIIEEESHLCLSGNGTDASNADSPSRSIDDESTKYMSLEKYSKVLNNARETGEISPIFFVSDNGSEVDESLDNPKNIDLTVSRSQENSNCRKTPKIIIDPGSPMSPEDNVESADNFKDEEDYLTAESEIEEDIEDATILGNEESKIETVNMSKVLQDHEEWVEAFEKVNRYNAMGNSLSSRIPHRREKIANYNNKLEKRWLCELLKKRKKCFETIDQLLKKIEAKKSQEFNNESNCFCDRCKRQLGFYNTIMACCDYYTYANTKTDSQDTSVKNSDKKQRRSISKSPIKLVDKNNSNCREMGKSPKRLKRKSLSKAIKSPVTKYKSPRRSMSSKSSIKKTPIVLRRNINGTSEIDPSLIGRVSQLRMIFSPRSKLPNSIHSKIPLPKKLGLRNNISECTVTSSSKNQISPTNKFGFVESSVRKIQFKHVKSPVGEYIRGQKK